MRARARAPVSGYVCMTAACMMHDAGARKTAGMRKRMDTNFDRRTLALPNCSCADKVSPLCVLTLAG